MSSNIENTIDWDRLPDHVLDLILEKIDCTIDVANFALVSSRWGSVFMHAYGQFMNQLVPMIMVPTRDKRSDRRSLYCITENKTLGIQLKVPFNKRCSGSSHGWLAFAEEDLGITLLNPLTRKTISLPPVMDIPTNDHDLPVYDINKVILSADPSLYPDSYVVIVKYSCQNKLCFLKAGEKKWTRFPCGYFGTSDMIYRKGKIYATTRKGKVGSLDTSSLKTELVAKECSKKFGHAYIVESTGGNLMVVLRFFRDALTRNFEVYKLRISSGKKKKAVREHTLDGKALFLGDNRSLSFVASDIPGCKPDCIYFSDDYHDMRPPYKNAGPYDMGVFNMADESIGMHYIPNPSHTDMPPPVWFLPDLKSMFSSLSG